MGGIRLNLIALVLVYLGSVSHVSMGNDERSFSGAVRSRSNSVLNSSPIRSVTSTGAMACTHACLASTRCISIAYCASKSAMDRGKCHLYDEGAVTGGTPSFVQKQRCTFYQFVDLYEGCKKINCQNGGTCYHDNNEGRLKCSCSRKFTGVYCNSVELLPAIVYRFTNLNSTGRQGPTNPSGYVGTTLGGRVSLVNGTQWWRAPHTGRYHFDIQGASGGDGWMQNGGKGARVQGYATLKQGDIVVVVVGQEGTQNKDGGGGGGGGSFVSYITSEVIGIAGGGGGGGKLITQQPGQGGLMTTSGGVYGGKQGLGGKVCNVKNNHNPGGGGGYTTDGQCYKGPTCNDSQQCAQGGGSVLSKFVGGAGDSDGGFGGGGAANGSAPGGGGGYSGGGVNADPDQGRAGGGGSKVYDTASWTATGDTRKGHGLVVITYG